MACHQTPRRLTAPGRAASSDRPRHRLNEGQRSWDKRSDAVPCPSPRPCGERGWGEGILLFLFFASSTIPTGHLAQETRNPKDLSLFVASSCVLTTASAIEEFDQSWTSDEHEKSFMHRSLMRCLYRSLLVEVRTCRIVWIERCGLENKFVHQQCVNGRQHEQCRNRGCD